VGETDFLTALHLSVQVPLLVAAAKTAASESGSPGTLTAVIERWRAEAVDPITSRGDLLQFRGGRPGQAGQVMDALAKGVAAASFSPGGIRTFGLLFCAWHHPGGVDAPTAGYLCPQCLAEDAELADTLASERQARTVTDPNPDAAYQEAAELRPTRTIKPGRYL
jgi:hypothetical protein